DEAATRELRAKLEAARVRLKPIDAAQPLYEVGRVSRRRICPLNPADASRLELGDGDLIELVGPRGPALRAWARLDPGVPVCSAAMPQRSRAILGAGWAPLLASKLGDAGVVC